MLKSECYFTHGTNQFLRVVVGINEVVGRVEYRHNATVVSVFGRSPGVLVLYVNPVCPTFFFSVFV